MIRGKEIHIQKTILSIIVLLFLLDTIVKADGTGAIIIYFPKKTQGLEITVYKIAEYDTTSFSYTEEFKENSEKLLSWKNSEEQQTAADQFASFAADQKISGSDGIVPSNGTLAFGNLSNGLYLIRQTGDSSKYEMQPALVPVPCRADNGDVAFNVKVYPKIEEKTEKTPAPEPSATPEITVTPGITDTPGRNDTPPDDTSTPGRPVKTGDDSPVGFYTLICLAALLVCCVLKSRKQKKEN